MFVVADGWRRRARLMKHSRRKDGDRSRGDQSPAARQRSRRPSVDCDSRRPTSRPPLDDDRGSLSSLPHPVLVPMNPTFDDRRSSRASLPCTFSAGCRSACSTLFPSVQYEHLYSAIKRDVALHPVSTIRTSTLQVCA